jgi:hypothetical protein
VLPRPVELILTSWGAFVPRELGFVKPPPPPPSFYNNGFGNIVRLGAIGEDTIIGYTI